MSFSQPVANLIHQRYSCRNYQKNSISAIAYQDLADFINTQPAGPFNAPNRFQLAAGTGEDSNALRGLGTYGTIKNAPGFIIGAANEADKNLEDFGYRMETIILHATDVGLGTCWLGGFFTRSAFSSKIAAEKGETIPAVCSVGVSALTISEAQIESKRSRLGWEEVFFEKEFGVPLKVENTGAYQTPLEMVRLAPSAQNKQPWRIVKKANCWHFYMQRTRGYREMALPSITGIVDLQRVDLGIAMSHFELAAIEKGLSGNWQVDDPGLQVPNSLTEYIVSWISSGEGTLRRQ